MSIMLRLKNLGLDPPLVIPELGSAARWLTRTWFLFHKRKWEWFLVWWLVSARGHLGVSQPGECSAQLSFPLEWPVPASTDSCVSEVYSWRSQEMVRRQGYGCLNLVLSVLFCFSTLSLISMFYSSLSFHKVNLLTKASTLKLNAGWNGTASCYNLRSTTKCAYPKLVLSSVWEVTLGLDNS